ncbi:EF hand, partial [Necator americanus]
VCVHRLVGTQHFGGNSEVHDEGHIKQHLEDKIDVGTMTEEQQRFHYFSMNDLDKDNRIDGIEIVKALTHSHEKGTGPGIPVQNDDELIAMVDDVLHDMDLNGDGYIDYAEYLKKRS